MSLTDVSVSGGSVSQRIGGGVDAVRVPGARALGDEDVLAVQFDARLEVAGRLALAVDAEDAGDDALHLTRLFFPDDVAGGHAGIDLDAQRLDHLPSAELRQVDDEGRADDLGAQAAALIGVLVRTGKFREEALHALQRDVRMAGYGPPTETVGLQPFDPRLLPLSDSSASGMTGGAAGAVPVDPATHPSAAHAAAGCTPTHRREAAASTSSRD